MKENTETISESIFTHFPSNHTRSYTRTDSHGKQTALLINTVPPANGKQAGIFFNTRLSGTLFSTILKGVSTLIQIIFLQPNKNIICNVLKKRVLAYRDQLQSGFAALGVGTVLLITVYLFLTQLAEYGWQ